MHAFLWLLGEAIFHFLPVGVCWSAVKKMGGSGDPRHRAGITLVSPQLMNAYGIGQQTPEVWDFGLFVIQKVGIRPRSFRPCWRVSSCLGGDQPRKHHPGLSLPGDCALHLPCCWR